MICIREAGPLMKEYAAIYGCEPEEVLEMVHAWCNGGPFQGQEATEKERLESVKGYIQSEVEKSLSRKIKREMSSLKRKAA